MKGRGGTVSLLRMREPETRTIVKTVTKTMEKEKTPVSGELTVLAKKSPYPELVSKALTIAALLTPKIPFPSTSFKPMPHVVSKITVPESLMTRSERALLALQKREETKIKASTQVTAPTVKRTVTVSLKSKPIFTQIPMFTVKMKETNLSKYKPVETSVSAVKTEEIVVPAYKPTEITTPAYKPVEIQTPGYKLIEISTPAYKPIEVSTLLYKPVEITAEKTVTELIFVPKLGLKQVFTSISKGSLRMLGDMPVYPKRKRQKDVEYKYKEYKNIVNDFLGAGKPSVFKELTGVSSPARGTKSLGEGNVNNLMGGKKGLGRSKKAKRIIKALK